MSQEADKEEAIEEIPEGDATSRLAVMGCDWDHVSASDLMASPGSLGAKLIDRLAR